MNSDSARLYLRAAEQHFSFDSNAGGWRNSGPFNRRQREGVWIGPKYLIQFFSKEILYLE